MPPLFRSLSLVALASAALALPDTPTNLAGYDEFVVIADLVSIPDPKGIPCSTGRTVETQRYRLLEVVCGRSRLRPGDDFTAYAPCPRYFDSNVGDRYILVLSAARHCKDALKDASISKKRSHYCVQRGYHDDEDRDIEEVYDAFCP